MTRTTVPADGQDRDATAATPAVPGPYRAAWNAAKADGQRGAIGYAARLRRDPSGHVVTASLAMLAAALMFVAQSAWAASPAPDGPEAAATRLAGAIMTDQAPGSVDTPEPGLDGDTASVALPGAWAEGLLPAVQQWAPLIEDAAERHGIPPRLLGCLTQQESGGDPDIVSPAGATGLAQLMPGTAAELGVTDSTDPAANLDGGARYLAAQYKTFGTWELALRAYNSGPGAVRAGRYPAETRAYVGVIMPCWGEG